MGSSLFKVSKAVQIVTLGDIELITALVSLDLYNSSVLPALSGEPD